MKFVDLLDRSIKGNNSQLCVGLDIDLEKIPKTIASGKNAIFDFNRSIIEATADLVCAYKPNIAFYERYGIVGIEALLKTIELIHNFKLPVILDAKRGDIGNSSDAYAQAAFQYFKADAITVNPYMGKDSVDPFIEYEDKGIFILCLTSNPGAANLQNKPPHPLFLTVAEKVKEWNVRGNCGVVVGATKPDELKQVHDIVGDMPILIPGVGAQGGDLEAAVKNGGRRAIINASRSIIYAADPKAEAKKLRDAINQCK
ncbi:MAG: orotidine-5'-phosphate decarboxylase [Candidatus Margulisbacteria bacterium]|nr:orotidine-5'-phosphate decarboxylase [Candidatus Margulisiibacteriota bacterium]